MAALQRLLKLTAHITAILMEQITLVYRLVLQLAPRLMAGAYLFNLPHRHRHQIPAAVNHRLYV